MSSPRACVSASRLRARSLLTGHAAQRPASAPPLLPRRVHSLPQERRSRFLKFLCARARVARSTHPRAAKHRSTGSSAHSGSLVVADVLPSLTSPGLELRVQQQQLHAKRHSPQTGTTQHNMRTHARSQHTCSCAATVALWRRPSIADSAAVAASAAATNSPDATRVSSASDTCASTPRISCARTSSARGRLCSRQHDPPPTPQTAGTRACTKRSAPRPACARLGIKSLGHPRAESGCPRRALLLRLALRRGVHGGLCRGELLGVVFEVLDAQRNHSPRLLYTRHRAVVHADTKAHCAHARAVDPETATRSTPNNYSRGACSRRQTLTKLRTLRSTIAQNVPHAPTLWRPALCATNLEFRQDGCQVDRTGNNGRVVGILSDTDRLSKQSSANVRVHRVPRAAQQLHEALLRRRALPALPPREPPV